MTVTILATRRLSVHFKPQKLNFGEPGGWLAGWLEMESFKGSEGFIYPSIHHKSAFKGVEAPRYQLGAEF